MEQGGETTNRGAGKRKKGFSLDSQRKYDLPYTGAWKRLKYAGQKKGGSTSEEIGGRAPAQYVGAVEFAWASVCASTPLNRVKKSEGKRGVR